MIKKIGNIFSSKIAKNGMWLILLQGFNTIIPLLTLPYITRVLSSTTYGEFSIAFNWISYFQVIVEYGFGLTGARKVAMRKLDEEISVVHSRILQSRVLLLVMCIVTYFIIIFTTQVGKTQIICMLILFLSVASIVFQQNWFFQGIAEMKHITLINVISRSISVALIFLFVKAPSDLFLFCFLYVSNFLISNLLGYLIVKRKYKVVFSFSNINDIIFEIKDSWYLFISSAFAKVFGNIGITVLGFVSTKSAVGMYSAINKIPFVLTLLFAAISQAIYPFVCKKFGISFKDGWNYVMKIAIPTCIFFSVLGGLIIILHYPIVKFAFGTEYTIYSTLLIPFVTWMLAGILNNFLGIQILVASGHNKEYSQAFQISMIILLILIFIFGNLFEAYGIAYASMLSELGLSLLLVLKIIKLKGE